MVDQVHALLVIEPADVADDRLERIAQPEPLPQRLLVHVLLVERVRAVVPRDPAVDLRVPGLVVDAIEDPAELVAVDVQGVPETAPLGGVADLPGVTGRDGGDEVGVDDPALEQVQGERVEVVLQPAGKK